MKCHVCAAVGVLMLAGPALTRWAQDDEVRTVSVAPSGEMAENQGVAAVLNRIFRSPVTEATTVATVQDDGELAQELRELAELEREVATRTAEEAERQFEEVLLQLELTEDEHARQQVEAAQRSLSEAERARLLAERFLAEGDLEDALSQLEQAEEARERAVEETTLMDELAELERAETECEALERALRENQRAAAELTFRGSHRQALESLEQALAQREVEFQQRDVRAEYERALGAYKRAESLRATRFIEAQRDRSTALGFARTRLAEAKADPERLTRWTAALERLGRRPEVSRDPANAISAGRSARQDNQAEIVERLKALDRRLAELGAKQEAAEHSDTCNHCDACRALHAERGAHTAPERTRRRTRGRGLLPSEPRAPRPPREPREPRAPRLPHEPRAPQASIYTRLPHAGLPTSAPRPEYSGLVPLPALTPAVPPPTPSTGESGCCCCSTCPRCGASTAPKSDTRPMTGGVSGIYATPRAFAKVPIEFGVFAGPPSVTPPTFPLGAFETPTLPEYSFGTWPTTETADDPCEADDDPDDGDTPGALVFGQLAEAWNGYNLAATAHPLGAAFQGFVLKTCSDGECGEKGCMTCNAGSWPGTQSETKDGTTYWVSGQGSGKSFVYYVGDEDDEEDEGGRFTWDTGSDNWFVTKSPGKGFVYSFGDDDEDEEDDDDDEDEEDGRFDWKTGTGNWFVTKGPGEGFVYSVGEDERFNWKTGTGNWFVHKGPGTDFDFSFDDDDVDELGDHGEVLAEILELMEDMSLHLEELRGDVRGLREEVGAYSKKVERRLPGARER